MPQVQLPVFPDGVTFINDALACQQQDGHVVYLNGHLPVFTHPKDDLASFRFFTTQLIVNGSATQGEISRAFGVPIITVKRGVQRHRTREAAAFFTPAPRRECTRLTVEVRLVAQGLLAQGQEVPEISRQTGVLASTIHKAIGAGRLPRPAKKSFRPRTRRRDHAERAQCERCRGAARQRDHAHAGPGGRQRRAARRLEAAPLLQRQSESSRTLIVSDCSSEALARALGDNDETLLGFLSEAGAALNKYTDGKGDFDLLLSGYSGDSVRVDRMSRRSLELVSPCLSLVWLVQGCVLRELCANGEAFERGLTARPLIFQTGAERQLDDRTALDEVAPIRWTGGTGN